MRKFLQGLSMGDVLFSIGVFVFFMWLGFSYVEGARDREACSANGGEFIITSEGPVCVEKLKRIQL